MTIHLWQVLDVLCIAWIAFVCGLALRRVWRGR